MVGSHRNDNPKGMAMHPPCISGCHSAVLSQVRDSIDQHIAVALRGLSRQAVPCVVMLTALFFLAACGQPDAPVGEPDMTTGVADPSTTSTSNPDDEPLAAPSVTTGTSAVQPPPTRPR